MNSPICIDAGVFIKVLIHEDLSEIARQKWEAWTLHEGRLLIAPALFPFEVISVLRKQVGQGRLTEEEGQAALEAFLDADIQIVPSSGELHRKAWELARRFDRNDPCCCFHHLPPGFDGHLCSSGVTHSCSYYSLKWYAEQANPRRQTLRVLRHTPAGIIGLTS